MATADRVGNVDHTTQRGAARAAGMATVAAFERHVDIEICTIEAKKDFQDWERHFFEAVSHRRYANRAYFAFPLPESSQNKLPDDLRYYSELYNVGVLTLIFSDEDYSKYLDGQPVDAPDAYVNDVVEVLANRSTPVPMVYQRRFCEALEIRDIQTLLAWGDR